MATGYTYDVREGKETTLRAFVLRCASVTDIPLDIAIQAAEEEERQDILRYQKYVDDARATVAAASAMTLADAEVGAEKDYRFAVQTHLDAIARNSEQQARYAAMEAKVEAWQAPAVIADLKEFMLDQLRESAEHDNVLRLYDEPKLLTPEQWLQNRKYLAARTLEFAIKDLENLIKRSNRAERLRALRASLPPESP